MSLTPPNRLGNVTNSSHSITRTSLDCLLFWSRFVGSLGSIFSMSSLWTDKMAIDFFWLGSPLSPASFYCWLWPFLLQVAAERGRAGVEWASGDMLEWEELGDSLAQLTLEGEFPARWADVVPHISAERIHRHMTSVAVHNKSKTNYNFTHACSRIDTVNNHVHTLTQYTITSSQIQSLQ